MIEAFFSELLAGLFLGFEIFCGALQRFFARA